ncbi:MAG: hypothetical protein ACI9RU_000998 [Litorivivens sp.]|jgi:hypothetical protein
MKRFRIIGIERFLFSSTLGVLLFLFALAANANANCNSDTLIVDGRLVVVNRIVEYDTLEVIQKTPEEIKRKKYKLGINIEFKGGPSFSRQKSQLDNLVSINDFRSKTANVGGSSQGLVSLSYHRKDDRNKERWYVKVGVGLGVTTVSNQFFPESELDTALWKFDLDPENNIRQIIRIQYDIGAEIDTAEVILRRSNISLISLDIPISYGYVIPTENKKIQLTGEIGLVNRFVISKAGGPILLLNSDADYAYVGVEDMKVKSYLIEPFIAIGTKISLGRNQKSVTWNPEFFTSLNYSPGIIPLTQKDASVVLSHHDILLAIGIRFFVKKNTSSRR